MEFETDDIALEKCRELIENQLGWGESARWSTNDYEILSTRIHEKTGVNLSIATLKRLWGKIKYDSKPTPTTLNTLAQYLGFENWRSFRVNQESARGIPVETTSIPPQDLRSPITQRQKNVLTTTVVGCVVVGLGFVAYLFLQGRAPQTKVDSTLFEFSSKKVVDEGVPNTVIFDYNASAALPGDSVFIQQSWDERLSRQVRRDQRNHSSIYYYPGFFEAKLVINKQIVKEHNLLITTNGWLPLVEQKGTPVYFKTEDAIHDGILQLPVDKIQSSNIEMQPEAPWTAYYNVREFKGVMSDDVVFETSLMNDYNEGGNACQYAEIRLQFEGPAIIIPLSAKGCVSNIQFGGTDGTKHDFSAFGTEFGQWSKIKCTTKGDMGEIFVDGKSAAKFRVKGVTARMVEIGFRFQGTGSVDFIRVSNAKGEVFYNEDF